MLGAPIPGRGQELSSPGCTCWVQELCVSTDNPSSHCPVPRRASCLLPLPAGSGAFPRDLQPGLHTFGISGGKIRQVTLLRNTPPEAEGPGVSQLWSCAGAGTAPWKSGTPGSGGQVEPEPSWPTLPESALLCRRALMQFFAFQ